MKILPSDFIQRIESQFPNESSVFLNAISKEVVHSLHLNPKHSLPLEFLGESVPWWENGYYLKHRPSFIADPLFHAGGYYPQESSSMFVGAIVKELVSNRTNIRCLDMCAAPGGKSILLSEIIGENGFLVANEVNKLRNSVLRENLAKWGRDNWMVTSNSASDYSGVKNFFDVVLIDAPCSGEGMFRKDDNAIREWSFQNVLQCSERQKDILRDVKDCVADGGYLVYSTCTYAPEENEGAIDWLLENGFEEMTLDIPSFEGIRLEVYNGVSTFRFYPHLTKGEGLFVCVLRKTSSAGSRGKGKGKKKIKAVRLEEVPNVNSVRSELVIQEEGQFFEVPCKIDEFEYLSESLYFSMPGTELGEWKKSDFIPGHGGLLAGKFSSYVSLELDADDALRFLKREDIKAMTPTQGWVSIFYKGLPLGWIKCIGQRKNNYYPKDWRIRYLES